MNRDDGCPLGPAEAAAALDNSGEGERLAKVELSENGERVLVHYHDQAGTMSRFEFPANWLSALVMTFPSLVQKSLRTRYRDPTLRLVYPADDWTLELAGDGETLILTLTTPDQFGVSFAVSPCLGAEMAKALAEPGEPTLAERVEPQLRRPLH